MKSLERLIRVWQSEEGVTLRPPTDERAVFETLERIGQPYARDLVNLYCMTGGMDGTMDSVLFSLWPLERVRKEWQVRGSDSVVNLPFADFLINSFQFSLRRANADCSFVHGGYDGRKLADSLDEFFSLRLSAPEQLDLWELE